MARQHAEASGHRVRLGLAALGFLCLVFLIPPPSYLVIIVLTLWERVNLARVLLLATIVPGAGVLIGLYYLVKALL